MYTQSGHTFTTENPVSTGSSFPHSLLPDGAQWAHGHIVEEAQPLMPEEQELAEGVVPSRRRELQAGRACARKALRKVNGPHAALPADNDRVPECPEGFCVSITHTGEYVAAAAGKMEFLRSLGIDAESLSRVDRDLLPRVADPSEKNWLASMPDRFFPRGLALIFSGKEAAYKCVFPLHRERLDFLDARLQVKDNVRGTSGSFEVSFRNGTGMTVSSTVQGKFHFIDDLVITSTFLEP